MVKVKTAKSANKAIAATSRRAATPAAKSVTTKADSKAAAVIALLRREGGATLDEMTTATGWQKHSVRGFLAGTLKKRRGLKVTSEKAESGRVYHIVEVQA